MSATGAGTRQGLLTLTLKDKHALYNAYMPFIKGGGVFVPTAKRYALGEEVFLVMNLPDSNERVAVAARVVWLTPSGAQGNRTAGIGVQFTDPSTGDAARTKIETLLAGTLQSDKPTQTM